MTINNTPGRTADHIRKIVNKVIKLYGQRGFFINLIIIETDFNKVLEKLGKLEINISSAREQMGEL